MPSVPNNGRTPFFSFDLDRKNSCQSLVLPYTEEVISRTFLGENRFRLVSHDHFLYKSSTPDSLPLKLPRWLRDFPSWRPQLFVSCNKSIQHFQRQILFLCGRISVPNPAKSSCQVELRQLLQDRPNPHVLNRKWNKQSK